MKKWTCGTITTLQIKNIPRLAILGIGIRLDFHLIASLFNLSFKKNIFSKVPVPKSSMKFKPGTHD